MPIKRKHIAQMLLALALFVLLFSALRPSVALAREYSMSPVTIDATVSEDGSVTVRETRRFNFDGSFHGVYWKLVKGTYEGRTIEPVINEAGMVANGTFVPFSQSDSEQENTYEVTSYSSYDQLKIYSSHDDESVDFVIGFSYPNLVSCWDDTAELYWKFISNGWDEPSNNVTMRLHLPVPSGVSVIAGNNVRAWGHGPLDANVSFEGNDVVYTVPGVGTSEFAEARVTFPGEWVPGAPKLAGARLDKVLAEEQRWADEANAQRERARMVIIGAYAAMIGVGVVTLGLAIFMWVLYKRRHRPQFDDAYFRDVPSKDHPAVLGALYRGGKVESVDFTASLMRLADMGKIQLDLIKYKKKGAFGREKQKQDYRLLEVERVEGSLRGDAVAAACDRIDREAMKFLFRTVADHHEVDEGLKGQNGEKYVLTSYFEEVARRHPESYENGYKGWSSAVKSSLTTRGFTTDEGRTGRGLCIGVGVLSIVVSMGLFVLGIAVDMPVMAILLLPFIDTVAGIVCIVVGTKMIPRSREAIELRAKLAALRKWLKDFTRLEEAIPTDVALWNQLLIMATVLGVADEVIRQLKVAMPRLLDDPYFYSYGWYYYGSRGIGSPAGVVGSSFGQAHSVSASKLASSSSSSGGGGGGGFSGGGGGGFGGGGGGGAF